MINQTRFLSGFAPRMLMWVLSVCFLTGVGMLTPGSFLVKDAEARLGRPVSPGSVAGVARRTTRRHERRHHYQHHHRRIAVGSYVAVMPSYCSSVRRHGSRYYICDNVYYRPYYEGNDVVYIVVGRP